MISKLHSKVGDILKESTLFKGYKIYQEYPVKKIFPDYPSFKHRFDWVIMDIFLVIECHGIQHYQPTNFGNTDAAKSIGNFQDQRSRDRSKMQAALDAGFTYIEIPYSDYSKITEDYIWDKYQTSFNPQKLIIKKKAPLTRQKQEILDKLRLIRSQQNKKKYQLIKKQRGLENEKD
jgi:hypothetical protein